MMGLDFIWEKVSATKCNKVKNPHVQGPHTGAQAADDVGTSGQWWSLESSSISVFMAKPLRVGAGLHALRPAQKSLYLWM